MKKLFTLFAMAILAINVSANTPDISDKGKELQNLYWKAVKLYNAENYAKALLYFNYILDQDTENYEYNYYVGLCYYQLNKVKLAQFYFKNISDDNVYKMKVMLITRIESDGYKEL